MGRKNKSKGQPQHIIFVDEILLENGDFIATRKDGTQYWYRDGNIHRDGDQPAVDGPYGKVWYQNGLVHRDGDRPAVVRLDKNTGEPHAEMWFKHGVLHRELDKPAVIHQGSKRAWCVNGEFRRTNESDAPLVRWDGGQEWYNSNGQLHRTNGPAVISPVNLASRYVKDGALYVECIDAYYERYYNNGIHQGDLELLVKILENGTKMHYRNNRLHNHDDRPAIVRQDGTKEWFKNGNRQRLPGPQPRPHVIRSDGTQEWYENDMLLDNPKYDGISPAPPPAIIRANGQKEWYHRGVLQRVEYSDGRVNTYTRETAPTSVELNGTLRWSSSSSLLMTMRSQRPDWRELRPDGTTALFEQGMHTVSDLNIPEGSTCLIGMHPLDANKESIAQCTTCQQFVSFELLQRWLLNTKTCPHCRTVWSGKRMMPKPAVLL